MEPQEVISVLRQALTQAKKKGRGILPIHHIEDFLDELDVAPSSTPEAQQRAHQSQLARFEATVQSDLEMFKSVIEAGREALKTAVLINGGAVIALLAFMSSTITQIENNQLGLGLSKSILLFGLGVLSAGVAFGIRYLTQALYASRKMRFGALLNGTSILLGVAAYVFFGYGLLSAFDGFNAQFLSPQIEK